MRQVGEVHLGGWLYLVDEIADGIERLADALLVQQERHHLARRPGCKLGHALKAPPPGGCALAQEPATPAARHATGLHVRCTAVRAAAPHRACPLPQQAANELSLRSCKT